IKPDVLLSSRDRLSVTLGHFKNPQLNPFSYANVPGYPITTTVSRSFGSANYTRTFSPTLLNEFRFTAQRVNALQSVPAGNLPTASGLGIGLTPDNPTGPPNLNFNSGEAIGFSVQGPTHLIDNTYTWSDTLTWTKGRHSVKTGFWYTPYQNNTVYDFYVNGEFSFFGASGSSYSGNDHADFLLGLPDELYQAPQAPSNIRQHNLGFFVQDEWKIRRNLTVTLGLRYEYSSPKLDTQGRSFSLAFGQQSTVFTKAPKGLLFPGDPGVPLGANFPDKNDWAPRFGFAWDPRGDGKMSIRGGFGVFYDVLKAEDNLQFNGQPPFFGGATLDFDPLSTNPTTAPISLSQPFVAAGTPNPFPSRAPAKNVDFAAAGFLPAGGGGLYYVDPHLRTPYIYQFNLSVQRELVRDTTLEVSFAGSNSHKLTGLYDGNPFVLGTTKRLYNTQQGLPATTSFSYLDTFANVGSANYNGLLVGLTKRYSDVRFLGNLQSQFSYTYGKSIDNISGFRSRTSRVPALDWNRFRAPSDYDLTHVIAFSGVWELPFSKMGGPKRLTHGWTLYPIVTYRSGQTLDVTSGISRTVSRTGPSGLGDPNLVRANLVNQIQFFDPHNVQTASNSRTGNFYFDPAAFERASLVALQNNTSAAKATYGTLGRNAFRGPDRTNFDLAVSKVTNLVGERAKFEIRGEFFNLLNHTEFNNPTTSITSSIFGQISSTADPRIIQLAARFTF
ncbi:MAG: TonB-dependent receptor, partial [Acidobacteriota bacterium]|nr:TonB-dependent receptor [Acidobacteriota bacterium]